MRLNEILTESQLEEGPILNKLGTMAGNAVGSVAKGVGAVAGGIAGIPGAIKKGFAAGKKTVGGAGDEPAAAGTAPASGSAAPAGTPTSIGAAFKQGLAGQKLGEPAAEKPAAGGTTATPAPAATGTAAAPAAGATPAAPETPAAEKPAAAPATEKPAAGGAATPADAGAANPKADSAYKQAQSAISKLAPEQRKEIMTMLQADPKVKAAMSAKPAVEKPAAGSAAPGASPKAGGTGFGFNPDTGEPFASKADADAYKASPAAKAPSPGLEPAAPTPDAGAGKLTPQQTAALKGRLKAGAGATSAQSGFKKYTKDASSQRIVGANPDGSPKVQQIKASKINLGNRLSETLAAKVEEQKHRMFESGLVRGEKSLFRTK